MTKRALPRAQRRKEKTAAESITPCGARAERWSVTPERITVDGADSTVTRRRDGYSPKIEPYYRRFASHSPDARATVLWPTSTRVEEVVRYGLFIR